MLDQSSIRSGGRTLLVMTVIGVGIAVAAILSAEWISSVVVPTLGPAEEQVVTAYTPLAFISIAALSAPVVAGIVGFFEGRDAPAIQHAAVIGAACFAGALVMVMIAGAGAAVADDSLSLSDDSGDSGGNGGDDGGNGGDDGGDGDDGGGGGGGSSSGIGITDLFALSGLMGVGSLVTGTITTKASA
jgi:uncharacterized membrane protein YgcG